MRPFSRSGIQLANTYIPPDHLRRHGRDFLERAHAPTRLDRWAVGLGYDAVPRSPAHRASESSSHLRVRSPKLFVSKSSLTRRLQSLDQVHPPRHPRVLRLHDALPPPLRLDRSKARLLGRVHQHRPSIVVVARLLGDHYGAAVPAPHSRLRLESVRADLLPSRIDMLTTLRSQLQENVHAGALSRRSGDPEV